MHTLFRSVALVTLLAGCWAEVEGEAGQTPVGAGDDDLAAAPTVTYHGTLRPIIEQRCLNCHVDGGAGPFSLETFSQLQAQARAVLSAVATESMPQWSPADDCHPIRDSRHMTLDEIDAFAEWSSQGRHEGDPRDYVAPPASETAADRLPAPSLRVRSVAPYQPDAALPDDYRCLILDHTFDVETFLVASDVAPDQKELVHHVILYTVPPGQSDALDALDAGSEGPGYRCFGGSQIAGARLVGGWVPGSPAMIWPEGSAFQLEEGTRIVAQFHYNMGSVDDDEEAPQDDTEIIFWTLEPGETPEKLVDVFALTQGNLNIEAGDAESVHEASLAIPTFVDAVAVLPHMHTLGTSIDVRIDRLDGSEACMIDIPYWDFNWQQFYYYPDDDPVQLAPGDRVRLRCEYDNSLTNQPVVNGLQQPPRLVRWGEGTLDEMCLAYVATTSPYRGPDEVCGSATGTCLEDCAEGDSQCALRCAARGGGSCLECVATTFDQCGRTHCPTELLALGTCLGGCEGLGCLAEACAEPYDTFYDCLEPHLFDGECDDDLTDCDLSLGR